MSTSDSDSDSIELTEEQLVLLSEANRLDGEPAIVRQEVVDALRRLDGTSKQTLATADNPFVADASAVDRDAAHDALEAMAKVADPVVVDRAEAEALDHARSALGEALVATGRVRPETAEKMTLDALASEFDDLDADANPAVTALEDLQQHPETGGADADETGATGGPRAVDDLPHDEYSKLERLAKKRDVMADRLPNHVENEIEPAIADLLGADDFEEVAADVEAL